MADGYVEIDGVPIPVVLSRAVDSVRWISGSGYCCMCRVPLTLVDLKYTLVMFNSAGWELAYPCCSEACRRRLEDTLVAQQHPDSPGLGGQPPDNAPMLGGDWRAAGDD